jgi:hypothetical protein
MKHWNWVPEVLVIVAFASLLSCNAKEKAGPQAQAPKPLPDSAFKVEWTNPEVPSELQKGQTISVKVSVKNVSDQTWPDVKTADPAAGSGAQAVRLSHRWWDRNMRKPLGPWVGRADLASPVRPGEMATFVVTVTAPADADAYELQFDLVQELVAWFQDKGAADLHVPVVVK